MAPRSKERPLGPADRGGETTLDGPGEPVVLKRRSDQKLIGEAGVIDFTTSRNMSKAGASLEALSPLVASTTMVTPLARL
jgi:hypothetical protein